MIPTPSTTFVGNGPHDPRSPPYPVRDEKRSCRPSESVAMMSLVQVSLVEFVTVTSTALFFEQEGDPTVNRRPWAFAGVDETTHR